MDIFVGQNALTSSKSMVTESRFVVARNWGKERENKERLLMGKGVFFW